MVEGDGWKVTVEFSMNRTVDAAALDAVRSALSPEMFEYAFRYKPEVAVSGLRYLQNNEPEAYLAAAQAIIAKPAKPSVRLERVTMRRTDVDGS